MGVRDVPIPERIGGKIPCERCRSIKVPEPVCNFCESYRYGHISEEEMRSILEDAARDSRLHEECAANLIERTMETYRPKREK